MSQPYRQNYEWPNNHQQNGSNVTPYGIGTQCYVSYPPQSSSGGNPVHPQASSGMTSDGHMHTSQAFPPQVTQTSVGVGQVNMANTTSYGNSPVTTTHISEVNRQATNGNVHRQLFSHTAQQAQMDVQSYPGHPHKDTNPSERNFRPEDVGQPTTQSDMAMSSMSLTEALQRMEIVSKESIKQHSHCHSDVEWKEMMAAFNDIIGQLGKEKHRLEQHNNWLLQQFQQTTATAVNFKKELDDMSGRLATEMGNKVSTNETSIENISIKNRPMKIMEDYGKLCTEKWLGAKQRLDETTDLGEKTKLEILCNIMKVSVHEAEIKQVETIRKLYKMLCNPMGGTGTPQRAKEAEDINKMITGSSQQNRPISATVRQPSRREHGTLDMLYGAPNSQTGSPEDEISVSLKNSIGDHFRSSSDTVDLEPLIQAIHTSLAGNDYLKLHEIKEYIVSLATLTWKMVNQRPKMSFIMPEVGSAYTERTMEIHWGSSGGPNNSTVQCCVHPALYHGDKIMSKAKVVLVVKTAWVN